MYTPPTIDLNDIYPMTEFIRNAAAFTKKIKKSKSPAVLTVNGRAELVVMDRVQYAAHLQSLQQIDEERGIAQGIADMKAGRTRPAREVFDELNMKFFGKKDLTATRTVSSKSKKKS